MIPSSRIFSLSWPGVYKVPLPPELLKVQSPQPQGKNIELGRGKWDGNFWEENLHKKWDGEKTRCRELYTPLILAGLPALLLLQGLAEGFARQTGSGVQEDPKVKVFI